MKKKLPILGILSIVMPLLGFLVLAFGIVTHTGSLGSVGFAFILGPVTGFIFGVTALATRERLPMLGVTGLLVSVSPFVFLFLKSR